VNRSHRKYLSSQLPKLGDLVPRVITLMMDNPATLWGDA